MLKTCNTCFIEKSLNEFHSAKQNKDGKQNICKSCESIRKKNWYLENKDSVLIKQKDYYNKNLLDISKRARKYREKDYPRNLEKYMLRRAKERASKRGLDFNLTLEDIQIPKLCPILGIELSVSKGTGNKSKSPSLDRIDPTLGYIKGNVWVISHLANTMKNCATTEELVKFAMWVLTKEYDYDTIRTFIGEITNEN